MQRWFFTMIATLVLAACGASTPGPAPVSAAASLTACKSVASFTASAAPQLQKEVCASCHGGTASAATAALDLTNIGKDNATACSQALRTVNLANRSQSALIQAVTGAQAHTGGRVPDPQAFTDALLAWINNE
jgi:hypothetical protein